jgi:hypothetical protein
MKASASQLPECRQGFDIASTFKAGYNQRCRSRGIDANIGWLRQCRPACWLGWDDPFNQMASPIKVQVSRARSKARLAKSQNIRIRG